MDDVNLDASASASVGAGAGGAVPSSDPRKIKITIKAGNRAALAVAEHQVRRIIADPSDFLAEMVEPAKQAIHKFVDYSNIAIGAQMILSPSTPSWRGAGC